MSNYSAWPVQSDVQILLDSIGVIPQVTGTELTSRIQQITDQVTGEVGRLTLRQFIADTEDTVRTYDGNGTAEIEIDEYISFTGAFAIGLQADPGYPLDNVLPVVEQNKPMTRLLRGVGSLPAFPVAAVYQPVPTIFPAGRRNIQVTATFGYAATVPGDLWQAVNAEIARRLAVEAVYASSAGRTELKEGDIATTWTASAASPPDFSLSYATAIKLYSRPGGRRLRSLIPRMI